MRNNIILVIAIIASIAISGGGVYTFTLSRITALTNEKANLLKTVVPLTSERNQLQNQVTSLTDEKTTLQTQITTLNAEQTSLQTQVNSLTLENTDLVARYDLLAETIDARHSSNWTQTVTYNITAGAMMNQSYILDKYGIVWDTEIDFNGISVSVRNYFWYKGIRHYVSSYSNSLIRNASDITYYGPQDYIYGTIKVDISIDYRVTNRIWIGYHTRTQFPEVYLSGAVYVDISS